MPSQRSCLIAVVALLGLGVLVLVGVAVGAWLFVRSETGRQVVNTAREGVALTREAATAPGTDALRAGGCSQALVIPTERVFELLNGLGADIGDGDASPLDEPQLVMCQVTSVDETTPSCPDVARIYVNAVRERPARFGVVVQGQGRSRAVCQGSFARDGSPVAPLDAR